MSGDYKYDIQMIADDIAYDLYEMDFYALSNEKQSEVYEKAMEEYYDRRALSYDR